MSKEQNREDQPGSSQDSTSLKFTDYYLNEASNKHPDIAIEWIERAFNNPVKETIQADGRIVRWGNIPEKSGRALRIVILEDRETIHNAFFDRNFYKRQQRGKEPT
ncbi:hypothetical protein [Halomicronema sp. CCY15110]|uniref:hypothetical protein n=1 Tax=Halomicronema sp. CCY15110 TaxID=2767773 RepID=UPI002814EBE9|nr:hypothetical protein [Halomicronema sp. CCY15110]